MDSETARQQINAMRHPETGAWLDPCNIATDTLRKGIAARLNRDKEVSENPIFALVELHLTDELPGIDSFEGIFYVDDKGIWYYDGDGNIDDPIWRQKLIPWACIKGLTLYQES